MTSARSRTSSPIGGTGYDYLPRLFGERLREAGVADEELRMLFLENPRRALAGAWRVDSHRRPP